MDKNYNKIESLICFVGRKAVLKMNVILSDTKAERYRDLSYHMETDFYSNSADRRMVNIKLNYRYFLSLETIGKENTKREYLIINDSDVFQFRETLRGLHTELTASDLYAEREGKVTMVRDSPSFGVRLAFKNKVVFHASTITDSEDFKHPGALMYINSKDLVIPLSVRDVEGLLYQFETINLYQMAQELVNYFGRPADGTNRFKVQY